MDDPRDETFTGEWFTEHAQICPGRFAWQHRTWWVEGAVGIFVCPVCGAETGLYLVWAEKA